MNANNLPTDKEIESIAMRMHSAGKPCLETILGFKVFYRPRKPLSWSTTEVNPFTGERGPQSEQYHSVAPAEFTFGYQAPQKIVIAWQAGDDQPPQWFRYPDK